MKKMIVIAMAVVFAVMMAGAAMAQSTGVQTITFTIPTVNELAVSSSNVSITITPPAAGDDMSVASPYTGSAASYSFTTNTTGKKITAQITTAAGNAMPAGTSLTLAAAAPGVTGWSSAGTITLSTTALTIASATAGTGKGAAKTKSLTYQLAVSSGTVLSPSDIPDQQVTLTLTN
jgi:hypothetical protein